MPIVNTHRFTARATRAHHACLAAAATLLLTPPLHCASAAQPPMASSDDVPHVTVRYRDLNLSRPADARALLSRIEWAARQVCGALDGPRPLAQAVRVQQCYDQAVARAVKSLHAQTLTAQYLTAFGTAHERPRG